MTPGTRVRVLVTIPGDPRTYSNVGIITRQIGEFFEVEVGGELRLYALEGLEAV